MKIRAYAKINIGLDILGRRQDGFHEIRTVMQQIDLYDSLKLERTDRSGIFFSCRGGSDEVPCDDRNLAWQAARKILDLADPGAGVVIDLVKNIPACAGLAGGSTDAAAVLSGMNTLFELGLKKEELLRLGKELGADVPFCILGGTALCEGIGEIMTALPPIPDCSIVLAKPDRKVSTKEAYESLDRESFSHPDMDQVVSAIRQGKLKDLAKHVGNVFQEPVCRKYPEVAELITGFAQTKALCACMSGSGPTVYAVFQNREEAEKAAEKLMEKRNLFVAVTQPAARQQ